MTPDENEALVRRAVEAIWNGGDLDLADRLFAPNYVNHGGLIPDAVRGPEAIKFSVVLYRTAFSHFQVTVEDLIAQGDTVAFRWTARSAPPVDSQTSTPRTAPDTLHGMTFSRLAGGQIVESWMCWDDPHLLSRQGT